VSQPQGYWPGVRGLKVREWNSVRSGGGCPTARVRAAAGAPAKTGAVLFARMKRTTYVCNTYSGVAHA